MRKLYCYVDESGQDSMGEFFIVAVVIADAEHDELIKQLEGIEQTSRKGRRKWVQTRNQSKLAYIQSVLNLPALKGKLSYTLYDNVVDYLPRTVLATARVITTYAIEEYKAVIFVDGLPKSQTRWFGRELRHLRIKTEKVRGVRKEEASALMRLADAVCGFVRAATAGQKGMKKLLEKATTKGYIRQV